MDVQIRKSNSRGEFTVTRDDGVTLALRSPTKKYPLPHDLVHFVVERTLGLERGFWGSLADGALFPSAKIVSGRQRPHAAERSKEILKSNSDALSEAEVIVGAFQRAMSENGLSNLRRRLKGTGRAFEPDGIERVLAALTELRQRWESLEPGECLQLQWKRSAKRAKRKKK